MSPLYAFVLVEWAVIILWGVTNRWPLRGYLLPMLFWAFFGPLVIGLPLLFVWEFVGGLLPMVGGYFRTDPVGTFLTFFIPALFVYAIFAESKHKSKHK